MTLVVFLAILCLGMATAASSSDPSLDSEWQEWKIKYGKNYSLVSNIKNGPEGPHRELSLLLSFVGTIEAVEPTSGIAQSHALRRQCPGSLFSGVWRTASDIVS